MKPTDQDIVEEVLSGKQHRFAVLVERYQGPIVNYVCKMIRNYDDAVDLSQDVFLKAYSALDSYRPQYPFPAWLFRIARNATIDEVRRRRLVTVSLDEPLQTAEGTIERNPAEEGAGPEELLLEGELESRVARAVNELPDKYREPLVLRHAAEMSYEEIADALELPLGTVKTRIFRAREALRNSLEGVLDPQRGAGERT